MCLDRRVGGASKGTGGPPEWVVRARMYRQGFGRKEHDELIKQKKVRTMSSRMA
jgi:hypothetical protein